MIENTLVPLRNVRHIVHASATTMRITIFDYGDTSETGFKVRPER